MRMKQGIAKFCTVGLATVLAVNVIPASAQYMYLDADGDGINTPADLLSPNGTPTTVDVWIKTNTNRDSSPAVCSTDDGTFTINSYSVNLEAVGGTVSYGAAIDRMSFTTLAQPQISNSAQFTYGRVNLGQQTPGVYRLMTVAVTGVSGAPGLRIIPSTELAPTNATSFGSDCSGLDFDNTLKMCGAPGVTREWCDTNNLGLDPYIPDETAPAAVIDLQAS